MNLLYTMDVPSVVFQRLQVLSVDLHFCAKLKGFSCRRVIGRAKKSTYNDLQRCLKCACFEAQCGDYNKCIHNNRQRLFGRHRCGQWFSYLGSISILRRYISQSRIGIKMFYDITSSASVRVKRYYCFSQRANFERWCSLYSFCSVRYILTIL